MVDNLVIFHLLTEQSTNTQKEITKSSRSSYESDISTRNDLLAAGDLSDIMPIDWPNETRGKFITMYTLAFDASFPFTEKQIDNKYLNLNHGYHQTW